VSYKIADENSTVLGTVWNIRRIASHAAKLGCLLACILILRQSGAGQTPGTTIATNGGDDAPSTKTTTTPPNGVEVEIGMGSRIGGPQISNYQLATGTSNTKTLSLTNLGSATPQLLTGLGFSCNNASTKKTVVSPAGETKTTSTPVEGSDDNGFCKSSFGEHMGAFASAQFGSGSNQTLSGYSVGATYAIFSNLRLLAGFSLTPVGAISPGFKIAASQYVTANPTLFPGVNPANLASGAYGAFDGIQTTSTPPAAGSAPTAVIYYPGSVTETHFRGGLLIGVAFPINVYNLISGNKKNQ
jgi:hypothetical protein